MAAAQSPEQRELSLVGKVEMRIALADSDAKLESALKTYLAPLLLKLASEHQSVRNKVVTVCQHVNTRVKPQSIQLPVAALVKQFKENENSMIRHFDLLYVQQGVGRLSAAEKKDLLPIVVSGIAKSSSQGSSIFNLLLRLLEFFPVPLRGSKEDLELRTRMEVSDEDAAYLSSWLGKFDLFTPQKGTNPKSPGLTAEDYSFLSLQGKENTWLPADGGLNLLRTKILAAKFLASGLFNDKERFLPALFASADTASTISDVGDDMMKRALPATDLEDEHLIHRLYQLYFGSDQTPRVRPPLRLKILALLNKSTNSTTFSNEIMRLVDDGISPPVMDGEDVVMSNGVGSNTNLRREATKLRSAIFTYINFVARYGSQDTLHAIASRVINRMRDFIENQGWPKPGVSEDLVSRGYAYEVIGLLAKAGPRSILVEDENIGLDLLRWFFNSLAKDSSGNAIVVSVEEALSTVLSALSRFQLNPSEQSVLEDLLIEQMEQSADLESNKRLRSTRFVALRFANRCLPYASVKARWVDILGMGAKGDRAEVHEEAERGLSPYWYRMLNGLPGASVDEVVMPTFGAVMAHFFAGRTSDSAKEPKAVAKYTQTIHANSFNQLTAFSRRILFAEAIQDAKIAIKLDSEWERTLDTMAESDSDTRKAIKDYMRHLPDQIQHQLQLLLFAMFESLLTTTKTTDTNILDVLGLAPDTSTAKLAPEAANLLPVLQSNNHNRRMAVAQSFGILASHPAAGTSGVSTITQRLLTTSKDWRSTIGGHANQTHGAVVALGYYFSRSAYRMSGTVDKEAFQTFVKLALSMLSDATDDLLQEAGYLAIGQLCMFDAITIEDFAASSGVRAIADKLYDRAKTGNESAILCLGQVAMVCPEDAENEDSDLRYIEERLHKLHEIRQAEVHFSVGEALTCLAVGWRSGALATKLDIQGLEPEGQQRSAVLARLMERILNDCNTTKPSLKKAAVIWLLCFVQFCGGQEVVQQKLTACQAAFKRCLSDRDELVQETASRGLGLVYEKGDRRLKDDLVRDLVSSFSSDKQSQLAGNVSADTQLFEPGALPTGDGSISTYKDIMSLASEVGDSSLVYRFMSMASSNAIWSSRAAFGRFGLSNVLSDSSVDGYLANNPKLYPKLFRYRFDPNSGVQRSMNDIWNALVKDSSATIDQHFDAIMDDLLINILGKEWRVRQASCAAIADLVSGRPLEKYEKYLEPIWTQCFKVLDDIKESVRAAAGSLARTLIGVLTRALEADHSATKNAAAMLKHVLPFLLSPSGMESSAKEVQAFSVDTLLEIIKKANGSTLRPFIPDLVERLIGLLSSLEPEAVNYIHLNASKYNLTEQKIDDMRLSSVRSSPLMEAIERCLDLLDEATMVQLQPRLESAMKSAVGLPSKVGSSRVLVSLSTRRMVLFRDFADDFLKLIEKLVLDRNETVSSSYAIAAGYVARGASDKQILRTIAFAKRLYFESEGDREGTIPRRSLAAGEVMYALVKHASDRFNALAASALPFVFVAKHDPHEQVREQFQNTWNDSVGGSRAVLLYLTEILELCTTHLDAAQWSLKHTSAKAVADATIAACSSEATVSEKVGGQLWPALEKALGGKTWDGKEEVLSAFVKFVESGREYYAKTPAVQSAITKIAIREAKRQNVTYRKHSVAALGQVALARSDIDMHSNVVDVAKPLLETSAESDPMEVDEEQPGASKDVMETIHVAAIEALFASVNPACSDAAGLNSQLADAFDIVAAMSYHAASVRRAYFGSIAKLFDRIKLEGKGGAIDFDATNLKVILFGSDVEVEAIRLLRADAIVSIGKSSPNLMMKFKDDVLALQAGEKSSNVRDRLAQLR